MPWHPYRSDLRWIRLFGLDPDGNKYADHPFPEQSVPHLVKPIPDCGIQDPIVS